MKRLSRRRRLPLWPVPLVLLAVACSRPEGVQRSKPVQTDARQVPFQDDVSADDPAPDKPWQDQGGSLKPPSSPPFQESQGLPAGTFLTVRLKSPVSADDTGTSETFDAVVDEPVLIEGSTMLPRGAKVAGRVESARASQVKRDRGYVRLTLNSIDVAGQELPIQTSSLFVRGSAGQNAEVEGENSAQIVRVEGGRRLTFQLTEAVSITGQPAISNH
jgi:hypothetical protein